MYKISHVKKKQKSNEFLVFMHRILQKSINLHCFSNS